MITFTFAGRGTVRGKGNRSPPSVNNVRYVDGILASTVYHRHESRRGSSGRKNPREFHTTSTMSMNVASTKCECRDLSRVSFAIASSTKSLVAAKLNAKLSRYNSNYVGRHRLCPRHLLSRNFALKTPATQSVRLRAYRVSDMRFSHVCFFNEPFCSG